MQTSQFCLATFECFSNHLRLVITIMEWGRVDDFSVQLGAGIIAVGIIKR